MTDKAKNINISFKTTCAYMLSPQLGRRIKNLSFNTHWLALLILNLFQMLGLVQNNNAAHNYEKLTIRGVMADAANNLQFDTKHADQIVLYGAILLGMTLLVAQFVLLAFMLTTNLAQAQFMGFFQPAQGLDQSQDIALSMLDQVFAVPCLYFSQYDPGYSISGAGNVSYLCNDATHIANNTPALNRVLHGTFSYYNTGMSMIAGLLVLYFLFVVIIETIEDGTPFGKRFASGYVPLRLIIALAFLVPTYHGFSTGQHIILNVAKIGSNFATNSWINFVGSVKGPIGNGSDELIPTTQVSDVTSFAEGIFISHVCATYYKQEYYAEHVAEGIYKTELPIDNSSGTLTLNNHRTGNEPAGTPASLAPYPIDIFVIYDVKEDSNKPAIFNGLPLNSGSAPNVVYYTNLPASVPAANVVSNNAGELFRAAAAKDIRIRFGNIHPDHLGELRTNSAAAPVNGGISPVCGELIIPGAIDPTGDYSGGSAIDAFWKLPALAQIQDAWYGEDMNRISQRLLAVYGLAGPGIQGCDIPGTTGPSGIFDLINRWTDCNAPPPGEVIREFIKRIQDIFVANHFSAYNDATTGIKVKSKELFELDVNNPLTSDLNSNEFIRYGWAGAGMWYNKISETYGAYTAAFKPPYVKQYPDIMNEVAQAKRGLQYAAAGVDLFSPQLPTEAGSYIRLSNPNDEKYALMISDIVEIMQQADTPTIEAKENKSSSFINFINIIFGLEGVFDLRENGDVHPFGMLIGAGKGLIDNSIQAFAGTIFTKGLSGFFGQMGAEKFSQALGIVSAFEAMAATVALTAGIIMFYVIPLTPFMYFFLAAGRWVKSIIEAMIAVPLWAMAHIRIDGTGLPGVAGNGYFLVFEIFLRPILTLFGLLASIATYGALMMVFNDVFDLIVENLANNTIPDAPQPLTGTPTPAQVQAFTNAQGLFQDQVDEMRGAVDMFFYTVLYAIIAYMMAMASFKLIDLIPDSILRWMGAGVKSFGDESGNIAEQLNRTISIQGTMAADSVSGIATDLGKTAGNATGGLGRMMTRRSE